MKKVLITGSAGLIGSQATKFFIEKGHTVVGIDNNMRSYFFGPEASTSWSRDQLIHDFKDKYEHHEIDIRDKEAVEKLFKENEFDLIIHTAAQPSHDWAAKEPYTDFSVNAEGTLVMLENFRQHSPDAVFIFTSTNKVYGDTPNLLPLVEKESRYEIDESHPFFEHGIDESMSIDNSKHSIFGASKVAADVMVQEYGRYFDLKTAVFRGGCLTGPGHSGAELHGFLAYLTKCVVTGKKYTIFGYKGKQVRDNIHSYDLVNAFYHFYKNPRIGEVYNMGGSRYSNISMMEAIDKLEKITGKKANIEYSDQNREGDHIWYVSDVRKFKSHYPEWDYKYDSDSILHEIVEKGHRSADIKQVFTSKDFKDLKIIIATHEYFKGTAQELKEFFVNEKAEKVVYLAHKLAQADPNFSYREIYENGKQTEKIESRHFPRKEYLLYVRDAFYSLYYLLTAPGKFDYYIGADSFNAIFGLFLRMIGKVDKVVFLTIDYIMVDRFKQEWLNKLYVAMDRFAFWNSDFTWNVSDRMSRQRVKELGEEAEKKVQLVVPIGVPIKDAGKVETERKSKILVYSGELAPKYGLEILLESTPKLIQKFPDIEIRIIGDGKLRDKLHEMAKDLKIEGNVNFVGYINTTTDRERWLRLLKESTLGIATYQKDERSFKQFSDVTKPKDYMSCGLPIITTDLIPLSEDIKKYNLGRVIEDNVDSFVKNISELLEDPAEIKRIQENIYKYSHDMTWENIFQKVFNEMKNA